MTIDEQKRAAAARAVDLIRSGMRIGLGTGSTAAHVVDRLGERVREGLEVTAVPTSEATRARAEAAGIRLATLDETPILDLAIDGADEIDPELNLIKGGGGALLREKIVASAARRFFVVADSSKRVERLGAFPLPIEVVAFGVEATRRRIIERLVGMRLSGTLRRRLDADGHPFVTDEGHAILDAGLGAIADVRLLAEILDATPGVVEHGMFIGLTDAAIVAGPDGLVILGRLDDETGEPSSTS